MIMTPSLGAGGVVGVEKINWVVVVSGFEIPRWKGPQRWAVIILVTWGFLSLLLPLARPAPLILTGMPSALEVGFVGEGACLSLDWLFPEVIWQQASMWGGNVILGTWQTWLISFQRIDFSQYQPGPAVRNSLKPDTLSPTPGMIQ